LTINTLINSAIALDPRALILEHNAMIEEEEEEEEEPEEEEEWGIRCGTKLYGAL
jgi:hypothetical protein